MARNFARGDARIGSRQGLQHGSKHGVLAISIRSFVFSLELDADRIVIASRTSAKLRLTGMPGALVKRHELHQFSATPDQQMRRYLKAANLIEVGVSVPVELVQEQGFDFPTTEFSRRQADAMQDDHLERSTAGARIPVRTPTQPGGLDQPGLGIHRIFVGYVQA